MARSFSRVAVGHSFLSVIKAESSARCSGQFGPVGIRGITVARIFLAVSALASKMPDYGLRRDRLLLDLPAIVIRDHGHRGESDFRFSRELGLRQIGHSDDVETVTAIQFRFRPGGKGRPIHVDVGPAIMNPHA